MVSVMYPSHLDIFSPSIAIGLLLYLLIHISLCAALVAVLSWSKPWQTFWQRWLVRTYFRSARTPWWYELATCPVCLGFWIGLFWGVAAGLGWTAPGFAGMVSLLARQYYRYLES